jgi:hypothetical protein
LLPFSGSLSGLPLFSPFLLWSAIFILILFYAFG